MKLLFFILLFIVCLFCNGADILGFLDSSDGSSSFVISDSAASSVTVIDSDGNLSCRGGMRLDSAGVKCVTAETLISDKSIGIGTTTTLYALDVVSSLNQTIARFGNHSPLYLIASYPYIGFNCCYTDSSFRYGDNTDGKFAATLGLNAFNGDFDVLNTALTGNSKQSTVLTTRIRFRPDGNTGFNSTVPLSTLEVNGVITAIPAAGTWYADNHGTAAPAWYRWGNESFNSATDFLAVSSDQLGIEILKNGYYLVCVNVLLSGLSDGERGDVHLYQNGTARTYSLGAGGPSQQFYRHALSQVIQASSGDIVKVYAATAGTDIYAAGTWSLLSITRLN